MDYLLRSAAEPLLALENLKLADLWSPCGEGLAKPSWTVRYCPGPGPEFLVSSNLALFTRAWPVFLVVGSLLS